MQILVAEDDRRMAELLQKTLAEEGHQVVVAHDGREAFEIAFYSPFDVIVLDVMLPGMTGTAVARTLRESRNQTPILMLTARDSATCIVPGRFSDAYAYLPKPLSIPTRLARVRAGNRRRPIARPGCLYPS